MQQGLSVVVFRPLTDTPAARAPPPRVCVRNAERGHGQHAAVPIRARGIARFRLARPLWRRQSPAIVLTQISFASIGLLNIINRRCT